MTNETRLHSPTDKFDISTVQYLNRLPVAAWQHLIPDLLTWLQDPNWPIFLDVRDLLLKNPDALIEPLQTVFETDDDLWQQWILQYLVPEMPKNSVQQLEPILVNLSERVESGYGIDVEPDDLKEMVDDVLNGIRDRRP
jgi:hypothetical protein